MKPFLPCFLLTAAFLHAADEDVLPKTYEKDRYESSWEYNPFAIKTVVVQKEETKNEEWALSGLSEMNGQPSVILINKRTREFIRIGAGGEDERMRIVSVKPGKSVADSTAVIAEGEREFTVSHDPNISAAVAAANRPRPGAGPQGQGPSITGNQPPRMGSVPMPGGNTPQAPNNPAAATPNPPAPSAPGITPPGINPSEFPGSRDSSPPSPASRRRVVIPSSQP
jgi:hypothetical protein